MTYEQALLYIHGTYKFGIKLGLENIKYLLSLMGNPQDKLKFIHVAGTNGKGSTCSYISSILQEAGFKTGLYISPYIQRFTERISINRVEISEQRLAEITIFVKSKIEEMVAGGKNHPTEFEVVTAIAFQYYFEENCDFVVLEVGMGGRFDATNVILRPLISVITTISMDHTEHLGSELTQIAYEKAGIIKEGGVVVLYPQQEIVLEVIKNICKERNANLVEVNFNKLLVKKCEIWGEVFDFEEKKDLKISLTGKHQAKNAAVAITAIMELIKNEIRISEEHIRKGLANTKWAGRFEIISEDPLIIIDGAHNEEGAKALSQAIEDMLPNKNAIFVFGVLKDKPYKKIADIVLNNPKAVITITPLNPRALDGTELAKLASNYCKNVTVGVTIEAAMKKAIDMSSTDDFICVFGSLSFIGEIKEIITSR